MKYLEAKDVIEELINDGFSVKVTEALLISLKLIDKEIKKEENKPPKRKTCICGAKKLHIYYYTNSDRMFYECSVCGRRCDIVDAEMRKGVQENGDSLKEAVNNILLPINEGGKK